MAHRDRVKALSKDGGHTGTQHRNGGYLRKSSMRFLVGSPRAFTISPKNIVKTGIKVPPIAAASTPSMIHTLSRLSAYLRHIDNVESVKAGWNILKTFALLLT